MLQKWSYNFHSKCQKTIWTRKTCPLRFLTLDNTRMNRPDSLLHWKGRLFFQKFVFSTTTKVLNNWCFNFHSKCQKTLWTLMKLYFRCITLDNTRKIGPKSFVPVKAALFWNVCFYRPLRSYRNKLITCKITVKRPCKSLQSVLWGFLHSIREEKIGQNVFFTVTVAFFHKVVFSTTPNVLNKWLKLPK